jgi:hypothetical protein
MTKKIFKNTPERDLIKWFIFVNIIGCLIGLNIFDNIYKFVAGFLIMLNASNILESMLMTKAYLRPSLHRIFLLNIVLES